MNLKKAIIDGKMVFLVDMLADNYRYYYLELFGKSQIIQSISAAIISNKADYVNIYDVGVDNEAFGRISGNSFCSSESKFKREVTPLDNGYSHCILYSTLLQEQRVCYLSKGGDEMDMHYFRQWLNSLPIPIPKDEGLTHYLFESLASNSRLFSYESLNKKSKIWFCPKVSENDYEILVEAIESYYQDDAKKVAKVA
ncbi:hypothetical protein [Helicobacter pullorum]|uniref:Uncharacterized protein n=1 Tax=Helicobacter pullorum TaxID=35818 RepID=A0A0N0LT17_9HELI|nr:hypothetical protein [Helicobacter pullorum]KPH55428.1 hypothetical protein HPU229334_08225 [Helicobacter pullorum]OCR08650.1 hypothetical protein A7X13_07080 [Helicobacter pullorum]